MTYKIYNLDDEGRGCSLYAENVSDVTVVLIMQERYRITLPKGHRRDKNPIIDQRK
jgi:hypothetical protein